MQTTAQKECYSGPAGARGGGGEPRRPRGATRFFWLVACLLAALAQVSIAGYQLGVGNQTIQIAFLKHAINPALYAKDVMVDATLRDYPSFFYPMVAKIVGLWELAPAYFALHVLTAFAAMAFFFALVRGMFRTSRTAYLAAAVGVALLLAGHHHALAGDDLYSTGFTHTWAVFPLAILALMLAYRDRLVAAMAVAGIIFNLHALTAAYLALPLGLLALSDLRQRGLRPLLASVGVFVLLALPTAITMALHAQKFDAQWIQLTHLRSADHSFPSSWWFSGNASVPRFALLLGLAAVSLSFPISRRVLKTTLIFAAGVALMCVAGYLFADIWPLPTVLRAQLFRSTRLLMVIMLAHIAYGIVRGVLAAWPGKASRNAGAMAAGMLEAVAALATLCVVGCPVLIGFLPHALALGVIAALVSGRLSWMQALVAGGALLVAVLAWRQIEFIIPGLSGFAWPAAASDTHVAFSWISVWALLGAAVLALLAAVRRLRVLAWVAAAANLALFGVAAGTMLERSVLPPQDLAQRQWLDLQNWAREKTDVNAVFLTPPAVGGFRVYSERSVVSEWRDGTQLYFTANFAPEWWKRMNALWGKRIENMDDKELISLAQTFGATHLVLPNNAAGKDHKLKSAWSNQEWVVYYPALRVTPVATTLPDYVADREAYLAQEPFFQETVLPNIEKYRKSDAALVFVDTDGRPVMDLKYEARQVRSRFDFGCTLPFFEPVDIPAPGGDFKPPPVTQQELDRFAEVFNASLIGYSSKWAYLEPVQGEKHFSELDKYINWCSAHNVSTEFHFITGLAPQWLGKLPRDAQREAVLTHARDVVGRYGDKIKYWQVINDWHQVQFAPELFAELRKINPNLKLGVSDCARLYSAARGTGRINDMCRGLLQLKALQDKGIKIDFFAPHAHQPYGLWPDARDMYETFDTWEKQGVKVHITEAFVPVAPVRPAATAPAPAPVTRPAVASAPASMPASAPATASRPRRTIFDSGDSLTRVREDRPRPPGMGGPGYSSNGSRILGPIRKDTWTRDLQAEHFERFLTICYSHPAVELVNLWTLGPASRMPGEGILDEKYDPYPAYYAIKKLIHEKFNTRVGGQLPLDGSVRFRGFQGDYEVSVTLEDGRVAKAKIALEPGASTNVRLRLNRAAGTLEAVEPIGTTRP